MNQPEKSKLISVGAVFSAVSFLYEYTFDFKNAFLTALIMILDIGLLLLNLYYLVSLRDETKKHVFVNTFLCLLLYFSMLSGLVMVLAEEHASQQVFLITLETLVYLGPSLILLLPVFYVIAEFFG